MPRWSCLGSPVDRRGPRAVSSISLGLCCLPCLEPRSPVPGLPKGHLGRSDDSLGTTSTACARDPTGAQAAPSPPLGPSRDRKSRTDPTGERGGTRRAPPDRLPGEAGARAYVWAPESFHRPTAWSEAARGKLSGTRRPGPRRQPLGRAAARAFSVRPGPLLSAHRCALCVTPLFPSRGHPSPPSKGGGKCTT